MGGSRGQSACAESRHATALYALHGEWVSYVPGTPDFVNQPFPGLFAEDLPSITPLVVRRGGQPEAGSGQDSETVHQATTSWRPSERHRPAESSQYGTCRPTKLDEIENLRVEVRSGRAASNTLTTDWD